MRTHGGRKSLKWWLLAFAAMLACTPRPEGPESPAPESRGAARRWHYLARLSKDLAVLDVKICFEGSPGDFLRPGKRAAAPYLIRSRQTRPAPIRILRPGQYDVSLQRLGADACLDYSVDLAAAARAGSIGLARQVEGDLLASPDLWLWRPSPRDPGATATLRIELPPGIRASLPWPKQGGLHHLQAHVFDFQSYAAFGHFTTSNERLAGALFQVSWLGSSRPVPYSNVLRWLREASENVASLADDFPFPSVSLLVVPSRPHPESVIAGFVGRGGAPSVVLLMASNASDEGLHDDWVATHELSHLLLPYVKREDAWLSEGLSTYYQDVLRARAGKLAERQLWMEMRKAMHSAAEQGTGGSVIDESRRMDLTHAYRFVYWSGAAYFLQADVALRSLPGGALSLDQVIRQASGPMRSPPRVWTASQVIEELTNRSETTVLETLRATLDQPGFPKMDGLFDQLGVPEIGSGLALDDSAPLARIRRAISGVNSQAATGGSLGRPSKRKAIQRTPKPSNKPTQGE